MVWEVVMKKESRIVNGFFTTQKDARKFYHEYHSIDWCGDIYLREDY